jgi:hypothetical protein
MNSLTITIPVFNDKTHLFEQLAVLYPQICLNGVQLKILDNDPFSRFSILELSQVYPNIQYFCHPKNVGADMNILASILSCQTKWVWVLSVNDLVKHDCVNKILDLLQLKEDVNPFFFNLGQPVSGTYSGLDDFVSLTSYEDSFAISRCLYNCEKIKDILPEYSRVVETNQGQVFMLFSFLKSNKESTFILSEYDPIQKYLPSQWSKKQFIKGTFVILSHYKILFGNEKEVYKLVKEKLQQMLYFQLFVARSYQKLGIVFFIHYFLKIVFLNYMKLDKFKLYCFIRLLFQREYFLLYRRGVKNISVVDDFNSL